jgi:predicted nucleic acid-binding protein
MSDSKSVFDTFFSFIADANIKYVRGAFFARVMKTLKGNTPEEVIEETKEKTENIIHTAEMEKTKEWITRSLKERQLEIDKEQTPEEIRKSKEEFRLRMYQVTSGLKNDNGNTKSRTHKH